MSKVVLNDVTSLANETAATALINANSAAIEAAMDNTLSLDGTLPNSMQAPLDMNSYPVINLRAPQSSAEPVRLQDLPITLTNEVDGITVENISLLRILPFAGLLNNQRVNVLGYYAAGDGGGGEFYWNASSSATDNGGTVINPTGNAGAGRWLRTNQNDATAFQFGAKADASTDNTSVFTAAVSALTTLRFEGAPSAYVGALSIRKNGFSLIGAGSSTVTIKAPAGALAPGGVIEVGDTASGNSATAYSNIVVRGVRLDGNSANTTRPASDVTGWGLCFTKITNFEYDDIEAVNCWNGGIGIFINSNYGIGNGYSESCGAGSVAVGLKPGLDINSSKFLQITHVSKTDQYGGRVLDNCWGDQVRLSVDSAVKQACIYNNQTANESYGNQIHVSAVGGCADVGLSVGANCRDSILSIAGDGLSGYTYHGIGVNSGLLAANVPTGNIVNVASKSCQVAAALIEDNNSQITVNSYLDGLNGAAGSCYAVDIYGNNNTINASVKDSAIFQVRGLAIRSGASDNIINNLQLVGNATVVSQYNDVGTRTIFNRGMGQGSDIASVAGAIDLPIVGSVFSLTGTDSITSINGPSIHKGRTVTFITTSTGGFTDGGTLKLNGNFAGTADDTITLTCDGTNFYEVCRSVN